MDLTFSEMSVDTSLAQEYLKKNEDLLELYNDYNSTIKKFSPYVYDGKVFEKQSDSYIIESKHSVNDPDSKQNLASALKQNATLITQLEYYFRNIPIEDTNAQLNLLIKKLKCLSSVGYVEDHGIHLRFDANDPLLALGSVVDMIWASNLNNVLISQSRTTVAICHLLITLCHKAGIKNIILVCQGDRDKVPQHWSRKLQIKGLDSGTVAAVSEDADVDSAVDKFLSTSKQAPWRLRRILVQENVYQQFKDALRWKCTLEKSESEPVASKVLCSETMTYNGRTFLIDPVEVLEEQPSVVTVEAYRTTKEMISLVQQDETRYLSLWANGIAEINEVAHSTITPVVWVNTLADFRGPPQVSKAVFSYVLENSLKIKKCDKVARLCELAQSWQKLDIESRRDILCGVLDKYISETSETTGKQLYRLIRNELLECTINSFIDVGKDYVCTGVSQPMDIFAIRNNSDFFLRPKFESLLQGNAFVQCGKTSGNESDFDLLTQAGVPFVHVEDFVQGDFEVVSWTSNTRTRVVWTNSGTIFAN